MIKTEVDMKGGVVLTVGSERVVLSIGETMVLIQQLKRDFNEARKRKSILNMFGNESAGGDFAEK